MEIICLKTARETETAVEASRYNGLNAKQGRTQKWQDVISSMEYVWDLVHLSMKQLIYASIQEV